MSRNAITWLVARTGYALPAGEEKSGGSGEGGITEVIVQNGQGIKNRESKDVEQ
jgi:hypothetical protein